MNLHGFTPQEYKVITELMKVSKEMYITICAENLQKAALEEQEVFYSNQATAEKLMKIAKENHIAIEKHITLTKSYRFRTKELLHLEQNLYANFYQKYEEENEAIKLFLAKNSYSEIEQIAKKIIQNVREYGYRYSDIGIITKDLATYSGLIKAIFSKYEIPVYIDEKKELSQNILIQYMISLLDIFAKNWSYDSVIAYIKTKFCHLEEQDIYLLENYTRKWGIKYTKWYQGDWNFGETKEILEKLNQSRRKVVEPLLKLKEKCKKDMSAKEISKAIYEFLIENGIDKILKEKAESLEKVNADLASEYEQSFNVMMHILDEIVKVFGEETISFEKYMSFLKISFTENGLRKIASGF